YTTFFRARVGKALDVAGAVAGGAAGGARAGLAAGAGAAFAQRRGAEGDLLLGAEDDVPQLDPHAAQHVAAAALARHRALAAPAHARGAGEHVEDVVEVEAGTAAAGEAAHARAAAHVVLAALVRMGEGLVGLGVPLELLGGLRIGGHVRVQGAGQLAVGLLDLLGRGLAGAAEQVVVVLVHGCGFLRGEWGCAGRDGRRADTGGRARNGAGGPAARLFEIAGDVAGDGLDGRDAGGVVHPARAEDRQMGPGPVPG